VWGEEMIVSCSQLLFLSSCSKEVEGRVREESIFLVNLIMIDETLGYLYCEMARDGVDKMALMTFMDYGEDSCLSCMT
jgi:hypothetical protein